MLSLSLSLSVSIHVRMSAIQCSMTSTALLRLISCEGLNDKESCVISRGTVFDNINYNNNNNNKIYLYSAFLLVIQSALQSVLIVINLIKYYDDLIVKKNKKWMNEWIIIITITIIKTNMKLQLKSTLKKKCFDFWFESFQFTTCA